MPPDPRGGRGAPMLINSYEMVVNAGFIIGFDGEGAHTAESMIRCVEYA